MVFFITFLRALAAVLITNSHYTGIYPTDIIANGGLLGDVIFFAVSGYCLFNVKKNFFLWYGKRLWRCFLPVWIITAVYMLLGKYSFGEGTGFLWWFIYPTNYHFVSSIVILYVPFYFFAKYKIFNERIPLVMAIIGAAYIILYFTVYDRSYYHIDNVREAFIRFLFMESMLLGAYFRKNDQKIRNNFSRWNVVLCVIFVAAYFASKLAFTKYGSISDFQFANQIVLIVLLYFIFRTFAGIDGKLEKMPKWLKNAISFVAKITLEIYVVQGVIISQLRTLVGFPFNWLLVTASIFVAAVALHFVCKAINKLIDLIKVKIVTSKKKTDEQTDR
ncbi:MAG: acyltransferase [Clostridia bacterium]|nr:acyltransferase [Clostridia bacterium]